MLCDQQIFSGGVDHLGQPYTQSLFLFNNILFNHYFIIIRLYPLPCCRMSRQELAEVFCDEPRSGCESSLSESIAKLVHFLPLQSWATSD